MRRPTGNTLRTPGARRVAPRRGTAVRSAPTSGLRTSGRRTLGALLLISLGATGCQPELRPPVVIFLDGAGYIGAHRPVRKGLRDAGYDGSFKTFTWTSFLGPGADHFVGAVSKVHAPRLARLITQAHRADPEGRVHLIGLSAGTAIIVAALERLDPSVKVDTAVLLSPSIAARHDLTEALKHVRRRLYATCSTGDMILTTLPINADGQPGPPAGLRGFHLPRRLSVDGRRLYRQVVNIPWRPAFAAYGWNGGHVRVTRAKFIETVIAPRLLDPAPYPLDRPLVITSDMLTSR